jgi:UMF1 family MFS transporter
VSSAERGPVEADPRARQREQRGWYWYDWANSAYGTTVVAVFLGPYLTSVARNAACGVTVGDGTRCPVDDPRLELLGLSVAPGSFYSYALALSIAVQVLVLPVTGAIADRSGSKRGMLAAFAFLGSAATMAMYAVEGDRYLLGGGLYLVANVSFSASIVVYNAFLPEIAAPDERDRVSARGWALGYLGGGLLLAANLVLYNARDGLGLGTADAVRISLLSAGAWWALFTLVPLSRLRPDAGRPGRGGGRDRPDGPVLVAGFRQLRATLRELRGYPQTLAFLVAYLVYNDGIQSVIGLASVYGVEELDLPQPTLIAAILLVQFVAFLGALGLGLLARRFGAKRVVLGSLVLWALTVSVAFFLQSGATGQFYLLAAMIGLVLGGSQALSRSLFSQMIPAGREAAFFSFYEISERGTSWLGALIFGLVFQLTGSYRNAIVSLVAFFVVGFVLLARVDVRRAVREAGNAEPTLL